MRNLESLTLNKANPPKQQKLTTLTRRCAKLLTARRPAWLLLDHSDRVVWHNYAALLVDPQFSQADEISPHKPPQINALGNQITQSLSFLPQGRPSPTQLRLQYDGKPVHLSCVCTPYLIEGMETRLLLCVADAALPELPKNMDKRAKIFAKMQVPQHMQFAYTKRKGKLLLANGTKSMLADISMFVGTATHDDGNAPQKSDPVYHKAGQVKQLALEASGSTILRHAIEFKTKKNRVKNRFIWLNDQALVSNSSAEKSSEFKKITRKIAKNASKSAKNKAKKNKLKKLQLDDTRSKVPKSTNATPPKPTPPATDQIKAPIVPLDEGKSIKNLHELVQRLADESRNGQPQARPNSLPAIPEQTIPALIDQPTEPPTDTPYGALLMLEDDDGPDEAQILKQITAFEERMKREEAEHGRQSEQDVETSQDGITIKETSLDQNQTNAEITYIDEMDVGSADILDPTPFGDDFDDDLDVFEADKDQAGEDFSSQFSTQKPAIEPNPTFEKLSTLLRDRLGREGAKSDDEDQSKSQPVKPAPPANVVPLRTSQKNLASDKPSKQGETQSTISVPPQDDVQILNRLPLALMIYRDNRILFANRNFIELVDFPSLEALKRLDASQLWPSAPTQPLDEPAMHLVRFDGEHVPVEARLQSIYWHDTQALLLTVEPQGQSQPKSEDGLKPNDLCSSADLFGTAISVIDEEGVIENANHHAQILMHQSQNMLRGQSVHLMLDAPSLEQFQRYFSALKQHAEATQSPRFSATLFMPSGAEREIFLTIGAAMAATESDKFYFVRFEDSTNQQVWTKGAEALEKQSLDQSARHADMLATLSHDIRTPLTSIIGFAQMLQKPNSPEPRLSNRQSEKLSAILEATEQLRGTLQDMTQLHALEADKKDDDHALIDMAELLRQSIAIYREQANQAQIVLRTNIARDLPWFEGRAADIEQIVHNLIVTAIKRSPTGHSVILSAHGSVQEGVTLNIKEEAPFEGANGDTAIFAAYPSVGDTPNPPKAYKSAFGFAIAKAMAKANGCVLEVKPAAGTGTLYSLFLPADRLHAAQLSDHTDA